MGHRSAQYIADVDVRVYVIRNVRAFHPFFDGNVIDALDFSVQSVAHQFQHDVAVAVNSRTLALFCEKIEHLVDVGHVEIAADAQALRFKYVASIDADLVDPAKYADMPQVSPENIVSNTGELVDVRTVEEVGVDSWNQRFFTGQIIYSKIRPALNKVTIAPFDGLCSADMYPISTKLPTRYLMYFMLSDAFVSQTIEVSNIRVKMPKVNQEELKNFIVVTHPQDAMLQIAEYLDERCEIIDAVLRQKRMQQDTMQRQKQSLIYEYVTGKKRVEEVTSYAD